MFTCKYCNQRYADTDKCCEFCGAPLPKQERAVFAGPEITGTGYTPIVILKRLMLDTISSCDVTVMQSDARGR